ncbi:type VII secretion protein EccE [Streptomyces sp. O3]
MGTATRGRGGLTAAPGVDASRWQRCDGGASPRAATLRPLSGTRRGGPVPLPRLVLVEVALALVAVGCVAGGRWLASAVVLAASLVLLAVPRRRGRGVQDWASTVLAFRARRRLSAEPPPDGVDARLAPVVECAPGLRPCPYAGRDRRAVGMLGDGAFLTAVVRVEAGGAMVRPALGARALPLPLLADALAVDDIALESAQVVQQVRPAPAPRLPRRCVARLSYLPLREQAGAPAVRMTWVALKLDPELCPEAVEARGGGVEGAQRCLVRAADHLASRVIGAGFRAVVLDQEELHSAVATAACANPVQAARATRTDAAPRRRTAETARAWRCDDRWHTAYAVGRWPELGPAASPLPRLVASMTAIPSYATTLSLTVRRAGHRGLTRVAGHVRVTGGSDDELVGVRRALVAAARSAKVSLVHLDREQLPGVLATLPLGGAR